MIASDWNSEWPSWMNVGTTRSALTAVISRLELLARENIDRDFLERQTLEFKRDPHAK